MLIKKGSQQKIETPSEAYGILSEYAKNPKDGTAWLGGPQNGNETPTESDYTKHRGIEASTKEDRPPNEGSDWLGGPQNGDEIPGNGGNGGNGGNSSGRGDGDATKVGSAYWQF